MSSLANDPSARKFSFELENVSSLSAALLERVREANLNPSHHIVEISLIFSTFNIIAASSLESHQKSLSSAPFHPFPRLISHYFPTITHHGANICSGVGGFTEKTTEEENFHVSRSLWESFCHISWAASSWREQCESSQRSKRGKTLLVTCESLRVAFSGDFHCFEKCFRARFATVPARLRLSYLHPRWQSEKMMKNLSVFISSPRIVTSNQVSRLEIVNRIYFAFFRECQNKWNQIWAVNASAIQVSDANDDAAVLKAIKTVSSVINIHMLRAAYPLLWRTLARLSGELRLLYITEHGNVCLGSVSFIKTYSANVEPRKL